MKKWYLVETIYRSTQQTIRPAFSEQWRIILADGVSDAMQKAKLMAKDCFSSCWEIAGVNSIIPLHELADGCELTTHLHNPADAENYCIRIAKAELRFAKGMHDLEL